MYEPARVLLLRDYVSKIRIEMERTITPAIHDEYVAGLAKQVETYARTTERALDRLAVQMGRLNDVTPVADGINRAEASGSVPTWEQSQAQHEEASE